MTDDMKPCRDDFDKAVRFSSAIHPDDYEVAFAGFQLSWKPATSADMKLCREAFEKWAVKNGWVCIYEKSIEGRTYWMDGLEHCWRAWQAAHQHRVPSVLVDINNRVRLVKEYRQLHGCGLKEAVDAVDIQLGLKSAPESTHQHRLPADSPIGIKQVSAIPVADRERAIEVMTIACQEYGLSKNIAGYCLSAKEAAKICYDALLAMDEQPNKDSK